LRPALVRVPFMRVASRSAPAGRLGPFDWRAYALAPVERVLVLRHRASGIVVAQGLLWADDVPDLRDTQSDTLLASLRALGHRARGTRLLGEQGGLATSAALAEHVAYIEALRRAVEAKWDLGDAQGASGAGVELPVFAALPSYGSRHALNVQHVWREFELRSFDAMPRSGEPEAGQSPTFQRSLR